MTATTENANLEHRLHSPAEGFGHCDVPPVDIGNDLDSDEYDSGPSLREQWQAIADSGDIHGVIGLMSEARLALIGFGDVLSLLRRAAEVAVRKNPSNFVDLVSTDMLGYLGQLVMRGHFYLNQLMTDEDGDLNRRRRWTPSRELDEFLPKLMSLQMHFAELAKAVASAKRLGELTRQRESAKRNMPRKRQRSPRRRRSTPKSRFTSGRGKKS